MADAVDVTDLDLPHVDYSDRGPTTWVDMIDKLGLGDDGWLAASGYGYVVLAHDDVEAFLRNRNLRLSTIETMFALQEVSSGPLYDRFMSGLNALHGDAHYRLRRLVSSAFTPKAIERHRPSILAIAKGIIDDLPTEGTVDLVPPLTHPYPAQVISSLVGLPTENWKTYSDWITAINRFFLFNLAEDESVISAALVAMDEVHEELIARRRHEPGDDLVSDLISAEAEGGALSHDELLNLLGLIVVTGTDTTRNQLALTLYALARHPEQWNKLRKDPDLVPSAVEETLRWFPAVIAAYRIVESEFVYRGVRFPKGTIVVPVHAAASLDRRAHPNPAVFDIERTGEPSVMTFGAGPHFCLGASLARAELEVALEVLTERWSTVELADEPAWPPTPHGIYGPTSLPITWTPG